MGAGGVGGSLAYQQTASFMFNAGSTPFLLALTGSNFLGTGFDSALFQVSDNGNLLFDKSFSDLVAAEAFFSNDLLSFQLGTGLNDIQISLGEMMSGGKGSASITQPRKSLQLRCRARSGFSDHA